MVCQRRLPVSLLLTVACFACQVALGQTPFGAGADPARPNVSATGTATVKLKPDRARMVIQLSGKGKTLPEALQQLKDRSDAAILRLEQLGAAKSAIILTEAALAEDKTQQARRVERMMMQQLRAQGRRVPAPTKAPKPVIAQSTLTAEWPLNMKTHEELLSFAKKLEDDIRAADLAGVNKPQELSPEEEELAEEMAQMASEYSYDEDQPKPGEPQFLYVANISAEQRQKTLSEAFGRAKAQAAQLAEAAGAQLGALLSLAGASHTMNEMLDSDYGRTYAMRMAYLEQLRSGGAQNESEAATPQAGPVSFQFIVQAAFELK